MSTVHVCNSECAMCAPYHVSNMWRAFTRPGRELVGAKGRQNGRQRWREGDNANIPARG